MDKCSGVTAIVEYDYAAKESDELDLVKGALIHSIKQMPGGWWEGTLQANGKVGMFPDNFVRVIDTNDESTVQLRNKAETLNRRCKVIFSYTQVNDDELSLAVGDVIEFLGEVEEGWWRGRLKNKVGVFPSNFVVAIEPSPVFASKRPPTIHATTTPLGGSLGGVTANKSAAAPTAATATTVSANASSASAAAVSTTTTTTSGASSVVSQTTKKLNRLSMHNSKTDLLNATTTADAAMHGDDAPSLPPKPQREYCRVDFPYAPQNEDELELKVGDIIAIVSMELPDKGWWKGELRGKVGVFPDNFVKLLAPNQVAPLNDTQPTNRTAKTNVVTASSTTTGNATVSGSAALSGNTNSNSSTTNTTTTTTHLTANQSSASTATTKVFIKKSGSTASSHSDSNRKNSFGSRDSLNDILSETGLPSGNVAAQRKSLENKNFDLTNPPDASTRMGMKKTSIGGGDSKSSSTTTINNNNNNSTNDVRKSLENLDEKSSLKTTPPPVLTKKPLVPNKKTTTVTSVAGNLLSGLKQKVKGVDSKLTTTVSHDAADGVGSSKMSPSGLPDAAGQPGAVVMRRAATIAVEDSDFDRVERASILSDMRANRVKAPKRRPPSAAINAIGETNNNNSIYLNGSGGGDVGNDDSKPQSSDDNSMGEDGQLAKPKPREWEKKKAPWMEELKASQVKKKTSPGVETTISVTGGSVAERTSKLFADEMKAAASSQSFTSSTSSTTSSIAANNLLNSTTKVQSSTISSSSVMQQSMHVESSSSVTAATSSQSLSAKSDLMSKSLSGGAALAGHQLVDDTRSTRPNSLALRKNSGASPSTARSSSLKGNTVEQTNNTTTNNSSSSNSNGHHPQHSVAAKSSSTTTSLSTTTTMLNNHHSSELLTNAKVALNADSTSNNGHIITSSGGGGGGVSNATGALRVIELEKRVDRLESVVQTQQRTIEDLVRTLREEKECVKLLRGELDKYAQCVTQV